MSNPSTEQEAIELETIEQEHHLLMGEAYKRLKLNPDFQRVITEGYLKDKVMASVSLLAVPQIMDQGKRPGVFEDIIAASNLSYFFQTVEAFYEGARNPILSDEEEEEILAAENGVN